MYRFGFDRGGYHQLFWTKGNVELTGADWLNSELQIPEWAFNYYTPNKEHVQIIINYVHQLQNLCFSLKEPISIK